MILKKNKLKTTRKNKKKNKKQKMQLKKRKKIKKRKVKSLKQWLLRKKILGNKHKKSKAKAKFHHIPKNQRRHR
jgi:hypothetical protein